MNQEAIVEAVSRINLLLKPDGGVLQIARILNEEVTLSLLLSADACGECILPRSALEDIILKELQKDLPGVRRVSVVDPRDH